MSSNQVKRFNEDVGKDDEARVVKRQVSERTLTAIRLENSLNLGNACPTSPVIREVPSTSPEVKRAEQIEWSFYHKEGSKADMKSTLIERVDAQKEAIPDLENELLALEKLSDHIEHHIESNTTTDESACQPPEHIDQAEVESGPDEVDGVFNDDQGSTCQHQECHPHHHGRRRGFCRKILRGINDFFDDVSDGVSGVFHSFTERVLPHGHAQTTDENGFSVHLPSQFLNGDPCRFGAHLNRSEKGYILAKVFEDTLAHKANLRESDILTHINGTDLTLMNLIEIQRLFMTLEKTFTLTILREVGEGRDARLVTMAIRITITVDVVTKELELDVVVTRAPLRHISTSDTKFITQDHYGSPQVYLNAEKSGAVCMKSDSGEGAKFQFEFYIPFTSPDGQLCIIRNVTTKLVYDVMANGMKAMPNVNVPDTSCLVDKRPRPDGSFIFESVSRKGYFLENKSGTLEMNRYGSPSSAPTSCSFTLF